eukprot:SAG22_NODE_4262_length_1324_cov_7.593113_2_plen_204_part_00
MTDLVHQQRPVATSGRSLDSGQIMRCGGGSGGVKRAAADTDGVGSASEPAAADADGANAPGPGAGPGAGARPKRHAAGANASVGAGEPAAPDTKRPETAGGGPSPRLHRSWHPPPFARKSLKMDEFSLKSTQPAPVPPSAPPPVPKSGRLVSAGDRPGPPGGAGAGIAAHRAAEDSARSWLEPGSRLGSAPHNSRADHHRWWR